jgi:hypothetical protein
MDQPCQQEIPASTITVDRFAQQYQRFDLADSNRIRLCNESQYAVSKLLTLKKYKPGLESTKKQLNDAIYDRELTKIIRSKANSALQQLKVAEVMDFIESSFIFVTIYHLSI